MAVRFSTDGQNYSSTSSPPNDPFTITCWAMLSADRDAFSTVWSVDAGTANFIILQTNPDGTTMTVQSSQDIIGPAMALGGWYQFAVTRVGTTATFYYANATAISLTSQSAPCAAFTATTFRIGESSFSGEWLNGRVANVKHYSTVLSTDEIMNELSQYQPIRTANLLRWHPFINAEQTDYSGNGNTLSGGLGATTEEGPPIRWRAYAHS